MFPVWKESMNPVLFCNSGVVVKKIKRGRSKFEMESLIIFVWYVLVYWLYYVIVVIIVYNGEPIANDSIECIMKVN